MDDNNLEHVQNADLKSDQRESSILIKDIAVDFEEQLYSLKVRLKEQVNLLNEKNQVLKEIERIKDHNLNLFSPIHSKSNDSNDLLNEIEVIKKNISEMEESQQQLNRKIQGLKLAAKLIDSININEDNINDDSNEGNIQWQTDKGLGILEAQEEERQRIARDLHDTTVQNLTSLVHKSELCIKLIDMDMIRAKLELSTMSNTLKMIINDMRGIIYNLKPMTLDDLGLTITIQRYANRITNLNNVHVKVTSNEEPKDILSVIKLTVFRIIQEACNNIIKHASATFIYIDINYEENKIYVTVQDNGIGFEIDNFRTSEQGSSFGLSIMRERVSLLSGSLDIKSESGKGTIVSISVPLAIYEGGVK